MKKYLTYIKENVMESSSLYDDLSRCYGYVEVFEILKRVYIEVNDIGLLNSAKHFFVIYFNVSICENMENHLFLPGQGFSINRYALTRWGKWDDIESYHDNWDYKITLTELANIVNSLPDIFKITIKKSKPIFNEMDPYGEEEWDY